jgi:hypothetical protein
MASKGEEYGALGLAQGGGEYNRLAVLVGKREVIG